MADTQAKPRPDALVQEATPALHGNVANINQLNDYIAERTAMMERARSKIKRANF